MMRPAWWVRGDKGPDDSLRAAEFIATVRNVDAQPLNSLRADIMIEHARLYEGSPLSNLYQFGGRYWSSGSIGAFSSDDVSTWNVARSVCQTAHSMIAKSRPRARFTTTDGDYKQKRDARGCTMWCDGWAEESGLYAITSQCLTDAQVFDVGAVQLFEDEGKVKAQRVLASELRVDADDGLYGSPRTLYRRRFVSRDVLIERYPDHAPELELARTADPANTGASLFGGSMIEVHEAWHLAGVSGKNPAPGSHIIAVDGVLTPLAWEEYEKRCFPIVVLRWDDALDGWGGRSLMSQLEPMQRQLDKYLRRVDRSIDLTCVPRVAIQRGSKISKTQIGNLVGGIIEYTTQPPTALTWPALSAEVYNQIEKNIEKMYALPGINRDAAAGTADSHAQSGVAKRESLEVQQGRMQTYSQRWENFHVAIFEAALGLAEEIVSAGHSYKVHAQTENNGPLQEVDFARVRLAKDSYIIRTFPVSRLPITPQGRLDYVQDMLQAGLWDVDRAKQAMEDLDVESANTFDLAITRNLTREMEAALYDGVPCHPDELTPSDRALKLAAQYVAVGRSDGCPDQNVDLLLRYIEELGALKPAAAGTSPGAVGSAAPPAPAQPALSPLPQAFA